MQRKAEQTRMFFWGGGGKSGTKHPGSHHTTVKAFIIPRSARPLTDSGSLSEKRKETLNVPFKSSLYENTVFVRVTSQNGKWEMDFTYIHRAFQHQRSDSTLGPNH